MKIDNYCIALLVLLLFFVYMDNKKNVEPMDNYAPFVASDPSAPSPPSPMPIGQQPRKVDMAPTMGVDSSLSMLAPIGGSYMLVDSAMAQQGGVRAVDSQIPTAYPRVGGTGNLGSVQATAQPAQPAQPAASSTGSTLEVHMVYTTWCGHSKRALPAFDQIIDEFDGQTVGSCQVTVQKHDADTDAGKAVAKEHNVRGFPTLFMIKDGTKMDAAGRSYEDLSGQIRSLCGA
tara:strand:+ start:43 stop:735 length:693 start_codon:yes stop_codon:yes gene_type:complete